MSNAIGCLVNRAEETQADVVVAPFFFCEDGGRKESDSMEFEQMSGIEYLKCILCSRAYWAMWPSFIYVLYMMRGLKGCFVYADFSSFGKSCFYKYSDS